MQVIRKNPQSFTILAERLHTLDGVTGKAGWFESSVYAKGTQVAYVASIHEFGYAPKNIPPRPFMRPTIRAQQQNWLLLQAQGSKAVLAGKETAFSVMDKVGMKAAGDIAKTITGIWTPPLKEATVKARARKLSDHTITESLRKPLIASGKLFGELLNSTINHKVEKT